MSRTPVVTGGHPIRVAIVGAGASGICMAASLQALPEVSFSIYEKDDRLGGTWRDNTYPGLFCDVPSRYYQFSFAPNPDWTRLFSPGPEIGRYLERVVDDLDLRDHITFGVEIVDGRFADGGWRLTAADGTVVHADFVVTACGVLHRPRVPDLPGLDSFAGAAFHSAAWDHSIDLRDARVGVVGTGSTGIQIVAELAGKTRSLTQFARTPQWVLPMPNPRYTRVGRAIYRRFPALNRVAYRGYQRLLEQTLFQGMVRDGWARTAMRWGARLHLLRVRDRALRDRLTPTYTPGCKRIVVSNGYYPALRRRGVRVVDQAVVRVEPSGVVTADGERHELDVLVLATGFDTNALVRPAEFAGPTGVRLSDAWGDGPRGYATVAVPGLPNLFMMVGPNSPVNVASVFNVIETQAAYIRQFIEWWRDNGRAPVAPRRDATDRFNETIAAAVDGTIWATGCDSWYMRENGTLMVWPWLPSEHRRALERPNPDDFERLP